MRDSVAGNPAMTESPEGGAPAAARAAVAESPAEATFAAAVAAFTAGREAQRRRDLLFEDVPAPKRLAPFAIATAATVRRDEADVAWGRLVLLYDPDGQQGWNGLFRLVAYVRADVEPEMAADPLLGEVGWSWLSEALDARVPGYAVPSGTVTRVITEGFGAKQDEVPLTGFELRASWSPAGPDNQPGFADHGRSRRPRPVGAHRGLVRLPVGGGRARTAGNTGTAATGARVTAGSERPHGGLPDGGAPAGTERPHGGLPDAARSGQH